MNDERTAADFESLETPLETAVRAILAEPVPDEATERVKTRAKQLGRTPYRALEIRSLSEGDSTHRSRFRVGFRRRGGSTPEPSDSQTRHWKVGQRMVAGLTAAVALLALVAAGLLLLNHAGGRAFAEMIEQVKAAQSVRFATATRFGQRPEIKGVLYLEGHRARFEQFDGLLIQVADLDRKRALFLDTHRKLAQPADVAACLAREFADPIDQLRRARSDDAEPIGEELLKGRRTQVFRLRRVDLLGIQGNAEMLIWLDMESQLPAKILIRDPDPKSLTEFRFEDFVWNQPLDAELFSLDIPNGFQAGVIAKIPSPAKPGPVAAAAAENPGYPADGILSRDRVPARIVWDPSGRTITALMRDPESVAAEEWRSNELRQWDAETGRLRWSEAVAGAGWLAATRDGRTLAIVIGYEVQLRDAATGKVTRQWAADEHLSPLAFSPDGKTLAAGITEWGRYGGRGGEESGGVQFWDIDRAALARSITDDKPVTFIRYSTDGKHVATSSNAGPLKLWDAATGELTRIFAGRGPADFSPDGQTLACLSTAPRDDKTVGRVELYDLRNGRVVKSFDTERGASASWLLAAAFSPAGRWLAVADWNGTVTLWEVATGARHTIADHQAGVLSVAFAPDGATFATGSEDKTLRLRKVPAGSPPPVPQKQS